MQCAQSLGLLPRTAGPQSATAWGLRLEKVDFAVRGMASTSSAAGVPGGQGRRRLASEKKRQETMAETMAEEMAMGGDDADSDDDVDVKPAHLPAADPTPHPLVGRRVKEKFVGHGWFEGKVVSCEDGKFWVAYDDGDNRLRTKEELTRWLVPTPTPKTEPKAEPKQEQGGPPEGRRGTKRQLEPEDKEDRAEQGWTGGVPSPADEAPRAPKIGDAVRVWFQISVRHGGKAGWEEGVVSRMHADGASFYVAYGGDEWPDPVDAGSMGDGAWEFVGDAAGAGAGAAAAAAAPSSNQPAAAAAEPLPPLPTVKAENNVGEHILLLVNKAQIAPAYKKAGQKGADFWLPKRVRGVVKSVVERFDASSNRSTKIYTVAFPSEPGIPDRSFTSAELKPLLLRGMHASVRDVAKHSRLLFCKWKHVVTNQRTMAPMRMHGLTEVLGGGYMDCQPGLSRAAWSTPGRGTLTRYKPNQPDEVSFFFAVNTQIHSMAPQCAGAPGSVFFAGIAPFMESAKQQDRPVPVFVCHHREADHSWEYCGHYEVANEESYHADAEIKEGEDEHGDGKSLSAAAPFASSLKLKRKRLHSLEQEYG